MGLLAAPLARLRDAGASVARPLAQKQSRRRSDHRLNMIRSGIETSFGGSVTDMSVADIACNRSGFSIEGSLRAASKPEAFDIRPETIAKAERLVRHFGLANATTNRADVLPDRRPGHRRDSPACAGRMGELRVRAPRQQDPALHHLREASRAPAPQFSLRRAGYSRANVR